MIPEADKLAAIETGWFEFVGAGFVEAGLLAA